MASCFAACPSNPSHLTLLKWSAHKRPNYHSSSSYGDCVNRFRGFDLSGCNFSHPFYEDLRDHAASFSSLAAFGGGDQLNVSGDYATGAGIVRNAPGGCAQLRLLAPRLQWIARRHR